MAQDKVDESEILTRLDDLGVKICGPNIRGFYWYVQDYKGGYDRSETSYTSYAEALKQAQVAYLPVV